MNYYQCDSSSNCLSNNLKEMSIRNKNPFKAELYIYFRMLLWDREIFLGGTDALQPEEPRFESGQPGEGSMFPVCVRGFPPTIQRHTVILIARRCE